MAKLIQIFKNRNSKLEQHESVVNYLNKLNKTYQYMYLSEINKNKIKKNKDTYYRKIFKYTKEHDQTLIDGYQENNILLKDEVTSIQIKGKNPFIYNPKLVVDHKISKFFGYKNNIPPDVIAHISNLRYIPSIDNTKKGIDNYIDDNNKWIIEEYVNKI